MKYLLWIILLFILIIISQQFINRIMTISPMILSCLSKGYSKEFCSKTPPSAYGPSSCLCEDGKLGRFIPGFGEKCLCYNI